MAELEVKGKKRLYQTDFNAWSSDVLGRRYYEKMRLISDEVVSGAKTRTAVKSANGCGKSMWLADLVTWWVTVFPANESLAIISAPTLHQIQNVMFKYLKDNYGYVLRESEVEKRPFTFPGWINESLEWKYEIAGVGNENIAFGKRPSDKDIVSTFQGTRKLRTLVALDEGGGIPTDLFTAAEAVATGQESRIVTIGNPDKRGTEFHRIFTVKENQAEWNTHTISAYELPTMTGEMVYPNDPVKQKAMLGGLTSRDWVEHKERVWKVGGKPDARFLAKVLGEFPGETDNTFFPQQAIDNAHEAEIDPTGSPVIMGVDLAAMGEDESVVYVNRGGRVRLFDREVHYDDGGEDRVTTGTWSKEDEVSSARRVHAIAKYLGADEVRVDAAGLGGGIFKMLERLPEFDDATYDLYAVQGANSSTDRDRWNRRKEENYDTLRRQLVDGEIDLDPADTVLRDELLVVTYDFDNRQAIKITPKKEMRSLFGGSPDRLDAVIYATCNPYEEGRRPGDIITHDVDQDFQDHFLYSGISALGW
jgi:hypothetical protein